MCIYICVYILICIYTYVDIDIYRYLRTYVYIYLFYIGIFLTDTATGNCRLLINLHDLAIVGGLDMNTPTYGFHTKWSHDGELIMVVVRTLHTKPSFFDIFKGDRNVYECSYLFI